MVEHGNQKPKQGTEKTPGLLESVLDGVHNRPGTDNIEHHRRREEQLKEEMLKALQKMRVPEFPDPGELKPDMAQALIATLLELVSGSADKPVSIPKEWVEKNKGKRIIITLKNATNTLNIRAE